MNNTATAAATAANLPPVAFTEKGPMKLRFEVDQAECFRRGIDCPKSIVTVEVKPSELPQEHRNLIADRLDGIDVCQLFLSQHDGNVERAYDSKDYVDPLTNSWQKKLTPHLIVAKEPTLEALLLAVQEDQARIEKEIAALKKARPGFIPESNH